MFKTNDQTVYVQIKKNAFTVYHAQENKYLELPAVSPFSTERLAVGNFAFAQETLKKGLVQLCPKSLFRGSPIVIMHQLYQIEDGLSQVEERVLRELAVATGAKQVYIWAGEPLSQEQLLGKVYEKSMTK